MSFKIVKNEAPNLSKKAVVYEVEFINAGLIAYPEDEEIAYLPEKTLKKMARSLLGCKVVLTHESSEPINFISSVWQDETTLKWKCLVAVEDDYINNLLQKKGWGFSPTYVITEKGESGSINLMDYDYEILDGYLKDLAIVENPRFNKLSFLKINSIPKKPKGDKNMGFLNIKKNSADKKKNEDESFSFEKHKDKHIVFDDGKAVRLEDLVEHFKEKKSNEIKEDEIFKEEWIEIDGERYKTSDLVEFYKETFKEQEEDTEEKENEASEILKEEVKEKENAKKCNSVPSWIYPSSTKTTKKNSAPIINPTFEKMRSSLSQSSGEPSIPFGVGESTQEKIERGKARYGRK